MPGFMFLCKSGQRVDARDYHNRTNHSEGAKLGGDVLQRFWRRKNWIKNRALRPVFFYSSKRSASSARGFPASVQSADRVHATGDKVQLNQCYCRETKSLRGSAGRLHRLNHPAQRTTGSRHPPASASTDRRNSLPHSRRRKYARSILFNECIYQ